MADTLTGSTIAAVRIKEQLRAWLSVRGFEWKRESDGTLRYDTLVSSLQAGDEYLTYTAASEGVTVKSHHDGEVECSALSGEALAVTIDMLEGETDVEGCGVVLELKDAKGKVSGLTVQYSQGTEVAVIVPSSTFWDELADNSTVIVAICGKFATVYEKGGDA